MKLQRAPELLAFFSHNISNGDPSDDESTTRAFAATSSAEKRSQILAQARALLADAGHFPTDELGSEANRWFADDEEARAWLSGIAATLAENAGDAAETLVVKDSNGALLTEGDSVT